MHTWGERHLKAATASDFSQSATTLSHCKASLAQDASGRGKEQWEVRQRNQGSFHGKACEVLGSCSVGAELCLDWILEGWQKENRGNMNYCPRCWG